MALMSSKAWLRSACRDVIVGSPLEPSCFGGPLVAANLRFGWEHGQKFGCERTTNVANRLVHVRVSLRRQRHEVEEQVDGILRVISGFLGQGGRRHANHILHLRLTKLQCRREKFRRVRRLSVREINESAACFGHDDLTERIHGVQNANLVVFH